MKNGLIVIVGLALLGTPSLYSQDDAKGGYAGAFFQIPAGARPTAMGGAYTAISNDGAAPLFNPAGLATIRRTIISSSYRAMQLDRSLGYVTAMFPVRGQSALGVHWLHAGTGSTPAYDADGFEAGHDVGFSHNQFAIVFAKRFEEWIAVGANMNYLYSTFPEISAAQVGFDFGAMVYIDQLVDREKRDLMPVQDIRIGATVKHINKDYTWNSENYNIAYTTSSTGVEQIDKVPIEATLGVSARFLNRRLLTAADLSKNEKQPFIVHLGSEYFVTREFAVRAGYYQSRLTAGTGYVFNFGEKLTLAVDYAFTTDRVDEGSEHIFSFDLLF